jgi:hypothetical protein
MLSDKVIVIDDFLKEPFLLRDFSLKQDYLQHNYHPGRRSRSFVNAEIENNIQSVLPARYGKILRFNNNFNCAFQINLYNEETWVHSDRYNNFAGVLFLTPDAPPDSGTSFYRFYDGTVSSINDENNLEKVMFYCKDRTKWETIYSVENKFNRLVLFDSRQYHQATGYFGDNIDNGRLVQLFFFNTQYC